MEMQKPQVDYSNTPAQFPPPGFSAYGEDEYGYWIELKLGEQRQRFRWVHRGRFMMGSPEDESGRFDSEKLHWVTLTKGYWLAETACSQAFWQGVMGYNPSYFKTKASLNLPVEDVSWNDCQGIIEKLNGLVPKLKARLPTEAEWEYACRAGTTSPFYFGSALNVGLANYHHDKSLNFSQLARNTQNRAVPVESFEPNGWGLYQMHGNVEEWCADWCGEYSEYNATDPTGPLDGQLRVLRGGSYFSFERKLRSAYRVGLTPHKDHHYVGFRLALDVKPTL